jgi:hypothetical protein
MNFADLKTMDLEHIQYISPIFAQRGLKNPVAVAAYYVLLLKKFPTTFRTINLEACELLGGQHSTHQVKDARVRLLREGFIAQVLSLQSQDVDFCREMYLPIAPELIWKDNISIMGSILSSEEIERRQKKIEILQEMFEKNFKKYGIRTEEGSISVFHNDQWLLYTLMYNKKNNANLSLFLGNLGSFVEPYIRHYEDIIKSGIKTKIIYDQNDIGAKERLINILNLKVRYPQRIEIRANPTANSTSRMFIYDTMAIDSKKLLADNKSEGFKNLFSPKKSETYYISTIYLQKNALEHIKKIYENIWDYSLSDSKS